MSILNSGWTLLTSRPSWDRDRSQCRRQRTWNTCGIGRAPTLMDRVFVDVLKVLFWRLQPDFKCGKGIVSKRLKTLETGMPPLIFGWKEWSYNTLSGPTILCIIRMKAVFFVQYAFISEYIYIYTYPLHVCTWCYDSRGSLQSNHCSRSNLSFAKKYQTTFAVRIHWIENLSEFHVLSNMHDDILYKTAIVWTLPH